MPCIIQHSYNFFSSHTPKPKLWIFSSRTPNPKLLTEKRKQIHVLEKGLRLYRYTKSYLKMAELG